MFKRKAEEPAFGTDKSQRADGDRRVVFVQHLKALNEQFAAWVQGQASGHPTELWSDGVEDYLRHAQALVKDFGDVLGGGSGGAEQPAKQLEAAAAAAPAAGGFAFGALPGSKPSLVPSFLGGSSGSQATPAFAALPSTSGGFNFSAAPATEGLFKVPSVPSTGTLGASGTTFGATTAQEDDGEEEEQQPDEPSVHLEPSDAEILLKQRVKLMSLSEDGGRKKWTDKGTGTLTLRRAKGEEAAGKLPYFVFTTDSGRVLINAPLLRNMKPINNPKTPTSVAMFLVSVVDGEEQRGMHLFKCPDAGAAKELSEKVVEFV